MPQQSHSFIVEYASRYGIKEAILINNFIYWIKKNKTENRNTHSIDIDGKEVKRTWTYNTKKSFIELFPYFTFKQIRNALDSLRKQKVLITSNFNKSGYDRTLWYAFIDEAHFIDGKDPSEHSQWPKRANGKYPNGPMECTQKGQPIPNIKPALNTNSKHYRVFENPKTLQGEKSSLHKRVTDNQKQGKNIRSSLWNELKENADFNELISLWNEIPIIASKHKLKPTKTLLEGYKLYKALRDGSYGKECTNVTSKWIEANKIPSDVLSKQWSACEIKKGIKNLSLEYKQGYYPFTMEDKKRLLPKSIAAAFYQPRCPGCPSPFLKVFFYPPVYHENNVKVKKDKHPELTREYKNEFFQGKPFTLKEENALIDLVDGIWQVWDRNRNKKVEHPETGKMYTRVEMEPAQFGSVLGNTGGKKFAKEHIRYLNELAQHTPGFTRVLPRIKVGSYYWKKFEQFLSEFYDVKLDVGKRYLKDLAEQHYRLYLKHGGKRIINEKVIEYNLKRIKRIEDQKDTIDPEAFEGVMGEKEMWMEELEKIKKSA